MYYFLNDGERFFEQIVIDERLVLGALDNDYREKKLCTLPELIQKTKTVHPMVGLLGINLTPSHIRS